MPHHEAEYPYISRYNMDIYLEALSNCILNKYGPVHVNMLLVGGSSLILGHSFRTMTEDIDGYIETDMDIQSCIDEVQRMFSITGDWLNTNVTKTKSFSLRLKANAIPVKSYGCLDVYKICDLDLICMKLISYREKDVNDLDGLVMDNNGMITQSMIADRLHFLYGKDAFDLLKPNAISYVKVRFSRGNL
jgi:hypothetical protein